MMKRLSSNSEGPRVQLIEVPMTRYPTTTMAAVLSVPRQPQRIAPQNSEKMKSTKKGLDGPSVRYWKTEKTTMSIACVTNGRRSPGPCVQMKAATISEYAT